MKPIYFALSVALFIAGLSACTSKNKDNNVIETSESQQAAQSNGGTKLTVDTHASEINWKGYKPGGSHNGTLGVKSGELVIEGDQLKSGNFVLDMNTITPLDLTDENPKKQLTDHLKSPDFFDVAKYPEGKFTITNAEVAPSGSNTYKISGNLELKGVSKNITFNAQITKENDLYKAVTDTITIDRTQWGINYGSKNIFKELKDKFINDEMDVHIVIVAKG